MLMSLLPDPLKKAISQFGELGGRPQLRFCYKFTPWPRPAHIIISGYRIQYHARVDSKAVPCRS